MGDPPNTLSDTRIVQRTFFTPASRRPGFPYLQGGYERGILEMKKRQPTVTVGVAKKRDVSNCPPHNTQCDPDQPGTPCHKASPIGTEELHTPRRCCFRKLWNHGICWFLVAVGHEHQAFFVIWGWGSYFWSTDCGLCQSNCWCCLVALSAIPIVLARGGVQGGGGGLRCLITLNRRWGMPVSVASGLPEFSS